MRTDGLWMIVAAYLAGAAGFLLRPHPWIACALLVVTLLCAVQAFRCFRREMREVDR